MRHLSHLALPAFAIVLGIASTGFAESPGQYIDDAAITTKIKTAIATDNILKNTSVEVTTNQGTVRLGGTVRSKEQEAEVVKIADHADGVHSVTDLMQVQATAED